MRSVARVLSRLVAVALLAILTACTRGPSPIAYGRDDCAYCRMVISDPRYGAELVTAKGKVHRFDSIECMASYYRQAAGRGTVHSLWVSNYAKPGTFIRAETAHYLRMPSVASPMGKGLVAVASSADADAANADGKTQSLRWGDVLRLAEREAMSSGAGPAALASHGPHGGSR